MNETKEATSQPISPILQSLPSSGTPYGIGYYSTILDCPRKARLNKLHPREEKSYFEVGKIYHAFQELYRAHPTTFEAAKVEFTGVKSKTSSPRKEAENLFRSYRVQFPKEDLGTLVTQEEDIPVVEEILLDENHQLLGSEEAIAVAKAVYSYPLPYTMRPDLVTFITEEEAENLRTTRKIKVTPGYWLIDFKTARYIDAQLTRYYQNSLQITAYQLGWNAFHPDKTLQGALVDVISKSEWKDPSKKFRTIVVQPPSDQHTNMLKQFFGQAKKILLDPEARDRANAFRCVNYFDTCGHMTSGACSRE